MLERFSLRRTSRENQPLRFLQVEDIHINPNQPRKFFDEKALEELAASIRQYGLINPLTVRETGEGYELIAGERRLRASRGAGLHTVPCYVLPSSDQDSSVLALAENLQRQDLDFYEEAQGIARLIHVHGLTQQQAADKLGKTQSAIANKLRLLRLPPEVIALLRQYRFSERHARALLRLENGEQQLQAARAAVRHEWTVAQLERYVESLCQTGQKGLRSRPKMLGDVRLFINTLSRAVETLGQAGVGAAMQRRYEGEEMVVTIRIPAAAPTGTGSVSP